MNRRYGYEWLTKGKRSVMLDDGKIIKRTVYPPRENETYPTFFDAETRRIAMPHDDGVYRAGAVLRARSAETNNG